MSQETHTLISYQEGKESRISFFRFDYDTADASSDEHARRIHDWLSPLSGDFEKKLVDMLNLPARQEETGKWLVNTAEFEDWFKSSGKTLACLGPRKFCYIFDFRFGIANFYCMSHSSKDINSSLLAPFIFSYF